MRALEGLQYQSQHENSVMRELAEQGSRDSASVRILTILTLIYLPCTVVSVSCSTRDSTTTDCCHRASTPPSLLTRTSQRVVT